MFLDKKTVNATGEIVGVSNNRLMVKYKGFFTGEKDG